MKALIVGPGKMGRAIEAVLLVRGHGVRARVGRRDDLEALEPDVVDVAFEFTTPEAAPKTVAALLMHRVPVVCGTTGWDVGADEDGSPRSGRSRSSTRRTSPSASRRCAARRWSSVGRSPASPSSSRRSSSGTTRPRRTRPRGRRRRSPSPSGSGAPAGEEIPIVSLRHGGQPGEHVLVFEGPDESIELVHRARSRSIFALGAVQAAEWLVRSGLTGPVTFDDFLDRRIR